MVRGSDAGSGSKAPSSLVAWHLEGVSTFFAKSSCAVDSPDVQELIMVVLVAHESVAGNARCWRVGWKGDRGLLGGGRGRAVEVGGNGFSSHPVSLPSALLVSGRIRTIGRD